MTIEQILSIVFFIIDCILCFIGIHFYRKSLLITKTKEVENETTYQNNLKKIDWLRDELEHWTLKCQEQIDTYHMEEEKFATKLKQEEDRVRDTLKTLNDYLALEEKQQKEQFQLKIEEIENEKVQMESEMVDAKAQLSKIKESISAGVQAQLREQEKIENLNFYKVKVSTVDLEDIEKINQIKSILSKPAVLNKLIWTSYYQKQTNELCNRVLGTNTVCGIYKITNLVTQQSYVGQSVDVASRWKDHIKCGLGIDASATNRLYNAMQQDGVHNFTFELLEICSREQLNEKERLWIEIYQTDSLGYNSTKGNK